MENFAADIERRIGFQTEFVSAGFFFSIEEDFLHAGDRRKRFLNISLRAFDTDDVAEILRKLAGQAFSGIVGNDLTAVDDDQTVADSLYFRQNVGRKNDRMAFAEHLDQIADLNDLHGVKADGRLVKDQYFGIADQSLRHTDSLPVTFGKVFDQTILHMVDLDPAADLVDMLLFRDLALFQIVDKPEIALNRHIHVQGRQLGKVSDLLLGFDRVVENIKAVDRN